jgi:Putative Ig domain
MERKAQHTKKLGQNEATLTFQPAPIAILLLFSMAFISGCAFTSASGGNPDLPSALTITSSAMPTARLQTTYQASLAATGGKPPYTWSIATGTLPNGLSLTASTGTISGVPAQSGNSSFVAQVEDSSSPANLSEQGMTIEVATSTGLAILTSSLPSGAIGNAYSITLSSTGGTTPIKWLISSGQLPAGLTLNKAAGAISGTPTQSGSFQFSVQATDSSSPSQTATQELSLVITNETVAITTASLPNGYVGAAYSAVASATGGTPPYTWSVISGLLPSGVTLGSANATFSGTPQNTGVYSFAIQVQDSTAATATAALSITVDSPQTGCGGPPIYCARSDRNLQMETPLPPPAVNAVFDDPDFGSRMVRVTDPSLLAASGLPNQGYITNSSAEQNTWNIDSTKFYVIGDDENNFLLYSFNPSTMQVTWDPIPGTTHNAVPMSADVFSRSNPNLIYGKVNSSPNQTIGQFDTSTNTLTDLVSETTCVPGLAPSSHLGDLSVSAGDQRLLAYEGGTVQDTDMFVVVYDKTLGCRWYNTSTGEIGGQWGPTGYVNSNLRFLLHNARIAISGNWATLDPTVISQKVVWQIGTLNIEVCDVYSPPYCGGHNVGGYTQYVNDSGVLDDMNILVRPFANLTGTTQLINPLPTPVEWSFDSHWSWNDDNPSDNMPVCGSTYLNLIGGRSITRTWDREVICIRTDGVQSEVWRFAHNRSVYNGDFASTPRGNVSQDGKFYMFTSTWENQLGLQTGSTTLYREDVFIVELH